VHEPNIVLLLYSVVADVVSKRRRPETGAAVVGAAVVGAKVVGAKVV
jgi:hypothetical protein